MDSLRTLTQQTAQLAQNQQSKIQIKGAEMVLKVNFTDEEYERLEVLCSDFNMAFDDVINYLIFKQFFFLKADQERKASQIEANET